MLEPNGICPNDEKRSGNITLIPWDVTCVDTFATFYLNVTSNVPRAAAEGAAKRKTKKDEVILDNYLFFPFTVETMGCFCEKTKEFLKSLGRQLMQAMLQVLLARLLLRMLLRIFFTLFNYMFNFIIHM